MPLFVDKGMLSGDKVGLFFRKESLFRGGSRGGVMENDYIAILNIASIFTLRVMSEEGK